MGQKKKEKREAIFSNLQNNLLICVKFKLIFLNKVLKLRKTELYDVPLLPKFLTIFFSFGAHTQALL